MKKSIIILLAICLPMLMRAQVGGCQVTDISSGTETVSLCAQLSVMSLNNPCGNDLAYAPLVPEHTPIKTIRIVTHVIQRGNGSDNFQEDNQAHIDYLYKIFNDEHLSANVVYGDLCENQNSPSPHIVDTRIRFQTDFDNDLFFWESDTYFCEGGWGGDGCDIYNEYVTINNILTTDQKENALHVFFAGCQIDPVDGVSENYVPGGYASGVPSIGNPDFITLQGIHHDHFVLQDQQSVWVARRTMMHELGHAFGLHHTTINDECNDTGTPHLNNIMAPSNTRCSFSECQISRMHYYLTDERCLTNGDCSTIHNKVIKNYCTIQPGEDIVIESGGNYTWTSEKKLTGNLIIESGGRLTIKCKIGMPEDARIIVEKNAQLIVDGGTITNNCARTIWKGILVKGDENEHQHLINGYRHQGYLGLRDATIENAKTAVALWDDADDLSNDQAGGVVRAIRTTFLNNWRDVEFVTYTNTHPTNPNLEQANLSSFTKCNFLTNDDYYLNHSEDPHGHVTMYRVNGIRFRGCKFENSSSWAGSKGKGIHSVDANFVVDRVLGVRSQFIGFRMGIIAFNFVDLNNYTVRQTNFSGNRTGIYNSGVDAPLITNCNFEVGDTNTQVSQNHGIFLNGGTGYIIENNTFEGTHAPFVDKIGIVARATGNEWNNIYKNSFSSMDYANLSNGDNTGGADKGLKYECNENEENRFDFSVPQQSGVFGISEVQSGPFDLSIPGNLPAGNVFTSILYAPLVSQFSNMGAELEYFADGNNTEEVPNENFLFGVGVEVIQDENTCADHMFTDDDPKLTDSEKESLKGDFHYHLSALNNLQGGTGLSTETAAAISGHASKAYYAANALIYDLLADSTHTEWDSLRNWWGHKNSLLSDYNIIGSYIAQRDTNTAKQLTAAIPTTHTLSTAELLDYNNFKNMQAIEFELIKSDRNWANLETSEINTLLQIAEDSTGRAGIRAQNVLSFHYGFDYYRDAILPGVSAQGNSEESPFILKAEEVLWSAYPNPATNEIVIAYTLPEGAKNPVLLIHDSSGKVVFQEQLNIKSRQYLWKARGFERGVYFYSLKYDDRMQETKQLLLMK